MDKIGRLFGRLKNYWSIGLAVSFVAFLVSIYLLATDKLLLTFIKKPISEITVGEFIFILVVIALYMRK